VIVEKDSAYLRAVYGRLDGFIIVNLNKAYFLETIHPPNPPELCIENCVFQGVINNGAPAFVCHDNGAIEFKNNVFCSFNICSGIITNGDYTVLRAKNNLFCGNLVNSAFSLGCAYGIDVEITNNTFAKSICVLGTVETILTTSDTVAIKNNIFANGFGSSGADIEVVDIGANHNEPTILYNNLYNNPNGCYGGYGGDFTSVETMDVILPWCFNNMQYNPVFKESITGTVSSISYDAGTYKTSVTDASASWTPGELVGKFLRSNLSALVEWYPFQFYIITNTENTITVYGDLTYSSYLSAGDPYIIFDYHLQSREDGDAATSRCIDAGDPADAFGSEPQPNGGSINLGAYGNTSGAARSFSGTTAARSTWHLYR
jgi:hypothetical protein